MPILHNIDPIFDNNAKILILGSFPSVKSREGCFFYNHPQNRFWKVISAILKLPYPKSIPEKKIMLLDNHIALWDVVESCEICGSSDSSIKNVKVNNFDKIFNHADIRMIFANGNKAYKLYMKMCFEQYQKEIFLLPSTSPANTAFSFESLCEKWNVIKDYFF